MNVYLTLQEFQIAMTKLVQDPRFKRAYSGDVLDLIYHEVKYAKFEKFKYICDQLLGSSKTAPLVPDFKRAMQENGVKKFATQNTNYSEPTSVQSGPVYHLVDDVWATDNDIVIRGGAPRFIIKDQAPEHPLVKLDKEVRSEKLREANKAISEGRYGEYLKEKSQFSKEVKGLKRVSFDDFKEAN